MAKLHKSYSEIPAVLDYYKHGHEHFEFDDDIFCYKSPIMCDISEGSLPNQSFKKNIKQSHDYNC